VKRARTVLAALVTATLVLAAGGRIAGTIGRSGQSPADRLQARLADGRLTLRVGLARGNGYRVVTMGLEEYVAGVLAGEAARNSPPAALEALAITVRTFAVANLGRHQSQGFDLCDQTHCQVYRPSTVATRRAADATAGEVLFYDGGPASVFYSAWCGGYTERPSEVWPGAVDEPYLPSRPDPACAHLPGWSAELTTRDLLRAFHAAGFRGSRLRGLSVAARDTSGRATVLRLDGLQPPTISGQNLRQAVGETLGWQYIRSTLFTLDRIGTGYRFTGRGSGHGVGLCVLGSVEMAKAGRGPAEILEAYFPGTEVVNLQGTPVSPPAVGNAAPGTPPVAEPPATAGPSPASATGIVVEAAGEPAADRASIGSAAAAARDELARRLGVDAPARIVIDVSPATDAYEQATGQPWYTGGAVAGTSITLAPLAALRAGGVLDRTIRREITHVLIDGALSARPQWVRDGVALFYADPRPPEAIRASSDRLGGDCPSDQELRAPVSAGDLANAYARAEACVARQIFKGKGWREVR
jgi:SpoIID/LytB domain protein